MQIRLVILLLLVTVCYWEASGQREYEMRNITVSDCEGFFLDSNLGDYNGYYDHNENYTFRICVPGADRIELDFTIFCLEDEYDYMRIYDGPDTTSTLLGYFTGEEDPPPLVATSGCMTINFITDANVACHGWVAYWQAIFIEPDPVDILPIPRQECGVDQLILTLDRPVPCDSLYTKAFAVTGPQSPAVSNARPLNCSNGLASQVEVNLASAIDFEGRYVVTFTQILGYCDIPYVVEAKEEFSVSGCPLNVVLSINKGDFCAGDSVQVEAEVSGGIPKRFRWQPANKNSNTIWVTPVEERVYSVTVTAQGGTTAEASITVTPNPLPRLSMSDTTFCQSIGELKLTASSTNGIWLGEGFSRENRSTGIYDPELVTSTRDTIRFIDDNDCANTAVFTIIPLLKGTDDASCPGPEAGPFQVSGGHPAGGSWSGPHISEEGLFTPPDSPGSFEVTYAHPNGCAGTKTINVGRIRLPDLDTICESEPVFDIPIRPFGGIWEGPGILDRDFGTLDPHVADAGDKKLYYLINGCSDSLQLFIKEIEAGEGISACPSQQEFVLPDWKPVGNGWWQGIGITDSLEGRYDPGLLPSGFRDTLTLHANGCTEQREVWVQKTTIRREGPLIFCATDASIELNSDRMSMIPRGGNWIGPAVSPPRPNEEDFQFSPREAPIGTLELIYDINTCQDTILFQVNDTPGITPDSLCDLDGPTALEVDLPGGRWAGPGIINNETGVFDPAVTGEGTFRVSYESEAGCSTTAPVEVTVFKEVVLDSLESFYCFQDRVLPALLSPEGGTLWVDSMQVSTLNPASMGPGTHQIRYEVGVGSCADAASASVQIGEPVSVSLPTSSDSICFGSNYTLSATAAGGNSINLTYEWDQDLGFGQNQYVQPTTPTTYTVSVHDGCSDPGVASFYLHVHRPIYLDYDLGPEVCYEDTTWASVVAMPGKPEDYTFTWNTDPPVQGSTIRSYPTIRTVRVTDNRTGCEVEEQIDLPGFPLIKANFGISPNDECLSVIDATVDLLDFSVGAETATGYWNFGNGTQKPYQYGQPLAYTFPDTGRYDVTLHIENEGGCASEFHRMVCVGEDYRIYAPNAFTPNGDGKNEVFRFVGVNVSEVDWKIFNRYGQLVYSGQGMEDSWNGTFQGRLVNTGIYTYIAQYRTAHGRKGQVKGTVMVMY